MVTYETEAEEVQFPTLAWQKETVQVPRVQQFATVTLDSSELDVAIQRYIRSKYGLAPSVAIAIDREVWPRLNIITAKVTEI